MKRVVCLIISFVLLLGILSGCRIGDGPSYIPTGGGLTWEEGETGPSVSVPQTQTQEVTLTYDPTESMNPLLCSNFTNRALFGLLYQSLFTVDRNYHVEPQLCSQYKVNQEMTVYTFYLSAATFSDGSQLTIQDVITTLMAAQESDVYKGRMRYVSKIAASADGGVEITLNTPYENLPLLLDIPILKHTQLDKDYPLGTGPYFFESTSGGTRLFRRDDWWCKADMAVTAPSISLVRGESAAQIRDNFEFSDLDLVCADPGSDRYVDFRCDYELWDSENGIFLYLTCNMDSEIFSNEEVRAALTHAIDRDSLVADYYRGFARSATLPASPMFPYYSQVLANQYGFDSVKFTQAVTDAGMREKTVVLLVNKDDTLRLRVAREIGNMLANCGLIVEMKELNGTSYQRALEYREYDLYLGQTKLSANMDLSSFFNSTGALSYGGINNVSMYTLCQESLANHGNYYTLHKAVMDDGRLCPILFRSYAIYGTRGLLSDLQPARDNIFWYSLGRTMENALIK